MIFTYLKIWGFNPDHLNGFSIVNLPVEEILFFIAIPYACMFTYDIIKNEWFIKINRVYLKFFTLLLAASLIIIAIFNTDKLYTSVTFFLTASFLLLHIYILKSNYLAHFYLSYLIIYLIPFIIVNGILTGSLIGEPIVWYNNTENLAIRIFTIPVEDFFYGMLLYLMNATIYEKLLSSAKLNTNIKKDRTLINSVYHIYTIILTV